MSSLDDLDDSALFCKSLITKRKAVGNNNPKSSKQLKLDFSQPKNQKTNKVSQVSVDESVKEKIQKPQECVSNLNESTSSYFSNKKTPNTCPLCLKAFKGDSVYSVHMKQCAKIHKLTTKQLLEALERQKKQMKERRNLGLSSQIIPSTKKVTSKPKGQNDVESYDLALGLALSKSLASSDLKTKPETQKSTLEEFGFVSSSTIQKPSRRKNDNWRKSVLKERTAEERQRIIVEKVAVILLDEEKGDCEEKPKENIACSKTQDLKLWNLGENHQKTTWYVEEIKTLLLSHEEDPEEIQTEPVPLPENIEKEISQLNLPQKDIHENWKKMINNSFKSDVVLSSKDNQNIYLHSLVLYTRCPESVEQDYESIFEKFNSSTVLIFLEYLYCGTLNTLVRSEINELSNLASDLNFTELITLLDCLNNFLIKTPTKGNNKENTSDRIENKLESSEKDLFDDEVINSTQSEDCKENDKNDEHNPEELFWSFIANEKATENLEDVNNLEEKEDERGVVESSPVLKENEEKELKTITEKRMSEDSATRDLEFQNEDDKMSVDCIILSSGSECQTEDKFVDQPLNQTKTSSPIENHHNEWMDNEVPHFDPYDNFHCFSEEQFSPVGLHSQSLLTGDISTESLKLSEPDRKQLEEEPKRTIGYCSTPVTLRQTPKIKSSAKNSGVRNKKKKYDLTASRILRKSLGLSRKSNSFKKSKRKSCKKFAEVLANSILEELSKSAVVQSSPVRVKNFIEVTPLCNGEEFGDCETPSPNFSNMGETMLKEELTKYGLKKNLAKSKARKILRHIFDELHPLYNTKTGKVVKKLPGNTPKPQKKSKPKNSKTKTKKNEKNQSKDSEELFNESLEKPTDVSSGSDFDDLNETLTQSTPSNPVDLPSAFSEYLQNNPEYHQKILLYEPIWLEELQKGLKETFKKHFKMSDIMDYLDQKCITFRSQSQVKKIRERNKKKSNSKKN